VCFLRRRGADLVPVGFLKDYSLCFEHVEDIVCEVVLFACPVGEFVLNNRVGDQKWFWSCWSLILDVVQQRSSLLILLYQFFLLRRICLFQMLKSLYPKSVCKKLLGVVEGKFILFLKVLRILLFSLLHSRSKRIMSFRRYSIAEKRTWLII